VLQPVDIAVAFLAAYHQNNGAFSPKAIHTDLGIPWSSLHVSLGRLQESGIVRGGRVSQQSLAILLPALQYVVPARPRVGETVRGVPTGASSPALLGRLVVSTPMVWESERGSVVGIPVDPLYRTIPDISLNSEGLHSLFGALDSARTGRARELGLARLVLGELVGLPEPMAA